MIFYFSGTGNSRWIAQEIAKRTNDEAVDIAMLRKIGAPHYEPVEGETIGFVFPIHAWRVPEIMSDFAIGMKYDESNFVFAVATCGSDVGNGLAQFAEKVPVKSSYTIDMPNNYIKSYPVDSPKRVEECVKNAQAKLPVICAAILAKQPAKDIHKGKLPGLKTGLIGAAFANFALKSTGFTVDDTCNSCGKCVTVCPIETISMRGGRPVWAKPCTQCTACIHSCPVAAIQDGNKSRENGRYTFERDAAKYL
jgi:ferredoxin